MKNTILIIFVFLGVFISSKIVQVPPVSSSETVSLRTSQLLTLDSSFDIFGDLYRIYKKEVYEIKDGKETAFPTCIEQPPFAQFTVANIKPIRESVSNSGLVYDFETVKYPHNLIDIALHQDKLYYMLENGNIKIDRIQSDQQDQLATYQYSQNKLAKGYFVILPEAINKQGTKGVGLFLSIDLLVVVFSLNGQAFQEVSTPITQGSIQSVIPLEGNLFAVACGKGGVKILSIDKNYKITMEGGLDSSNKELKQSCNIRDIAYDLKRKILFVLNHNTGVLSLQMTLTTPLEIKVTSSVINVPSCNVIFYDSYQQQLYLSCRELQKYLISQWPVINEKVLPKQDISIKDIIATPQLVALVGRNVFEIISAERKTTVYRDKLLDKLILNQTFFVSANQNGILTGNYTIDPPSISCITRDTSALGTHKLVLKVTASCNPQFFKSIDFHPGTLASDDKCVYTIYQNLQIWEPSDIDTKPFIIVTVLIGLLALIILVWWGLSHLNLQKFKNYVENYRELEEEGRESGRDSPSEEKKNESRKAETSEKMTVKPEQENADIPDTGLHDIE